MGDRDWYLAVVSFAISSPIGPFGRNYGQGKVSKIDNDEYGGRHVTMSDESNYSESLGRSVECENLPADLRSCL